MLTHHVHMHPGQDPKLQAAAYAIAHTAKTHTFQLGAWSFSGRSADITANRATRLTSGDGDHVT
ncbi:MAG: hypothetical protein QOH09_2546 [Pseudonocardiales bacterium]|nr:hypothetical protein [Pseudonocardiales bacterium]